MKAKYLSLLVLAISLTACSSSSSDDEPSAPQYKEEVTDWTVEHCESSWQNPAWTYRVNETKSCLDWKKEHEINLVAHYPMKDNHEEWKWRVKFQNTKESAVVAEIHKFIKFTLNPVPNENGLSGIDTYTARLYGDTRDYTVDYSYNPDKATSEANVWSLVFKETRCILPNDPISTPAGYNEWVDANKQYFISSTGAKPTVTFTWKKTMTVFSSAVVNEQIVPFIHMSCQGKIPGSGSIDRFTVEVEKEGSGIVAEYGYQKY